MITPSLRTDVRLMAQSLNVSVAFFRHIPTRALTIWLLLGVCLFVSMAASASEYSGRLDSIISTYEGLQNTWYSQIKGYAEKLFWLLVVIDVGWTAVIYAMEKGDIGEIAVSMVKKIFTIGFFWGLLKLSDTWIPAIIDSFTQIGTSVGGVAASAATPDGIVALGWRYATNGLGAMRQLNALETLAVVLPVTVLAVLIFLCFLFVSLTLMITLLESYLVIGAGVILLGFGGSRWTTDFATKYLQHAVGTGLKLMLIYLLVGAAGELFAGLAIRRGDLIGSLFTLFGAAAAYAYFVLKIPQIASAMMSGSPALTTGDAMGTALAVGAAMAGVGAAGAALGGAAIGGATNAAAGATGLAKALGAGASSGLDMGKSGMGLGAHAVGEVAKHGMGLGAGAVGGALNSVKTSFAEKVDDSTGGKIASSIEATRGGSMSGVGMPAGGGAAAGGSAGGAPVVSSGGGVSGAGVGGAAPAGAAAGSAAAAPSFGASSSATTSDGSATPAMPLSGATGTGNTTAAGVGAGDASTAAIAGPSTSRMEPQTRGSEPMTDRIRALQGYVPQDMAGAATLGIDVKHTHD